jgi:hypothetical protein
MERQIADVLNSQNNCEATLGEKTIGSNIPIIYQVVQGQPVAKFNVSSVTSSKIQITSMKVKNVDLNGGNGSSALASLEVTFSRPSSAYGSREIKKEIVLNANLCQKKWIQHADLKELLKLCSTGQIVDGPNSWGSTYWAACQDCSMSSSKTIYSCQAKGGSTGVDTGNMTKVICYNMGGTFDDVTSVCSLRDKIAEDSCYAIGGVLDPASGSCMFDLPQKNLLGYINSLIDKKLPACVIMSECRAPYSTQGSTFNVTVNAQVPYPEYTKTCVSTYKRIWETNFLGAPTAKTVLCAANYNQYATTNQSCGPFVTRDINGACPLPDWILTCSGCGQGCFKKTSYQCIVSSTVTKTEPGVTAGKLYTCCR